MKVRHKDPTLDRIERDANFTGGWQSGFVSSYRRRMGAIRSAVSPHDLSQLKGNRFEKLKGARSHQHSVRINDQYRLILEFEDTDQGKVVVIVGIEDYH